MKNLRETNETLYSLVSNLTEGKSMGKGHKDSVLEKAVAPYVRWLLDRFIKFLDKNLYLSRPKISYLGKSDAIIRATGETKKGGDIEWSLKISFYKDFLHYQLSHKTSDMDKMQTDHVKVYLDSDPIGPLQKIANYLNKL